MVSFISLGLLILVLGVLIGLVLVLTQVKSQLQASTTINQQLQSVLSAELRDNRQEIAVQITQGQDGLLKTITGTSKLQNDQLQALMQTNEQRMHQLRESVEKRLATLQQDNNQKLEQMRKTVDEKLHDTLEKRLGDSFKLVSERLEHVYKGLGEMQQLAAGVGDLKNILANVKTRGMWGEVQCANLLEQVLTADQYEVQAAVHPGTKDRVDFAIKLPGKDKGPVYLPLDSKVPLDTYQALVEAQEQADKEAVGLLSKALERQIMLEAKSISSKYIAPPHTTDFAILYLPIEGLYAEVLRLNQLYDTLQTKYRVIIAGPTTLAALLNALQMGFKTLAIEKRSSDVWNVLAAVKEEFMKFGDILDKTHKKLQEAGNTIETASRKSRTIERKLRNVEALPEQLGDVAQSVLQSNPVQVQ